MKNPTTREREASLDWDDYFWMIAEVVKKKSRDPDKQVGAVIVGDGHSVLSTGYNGPARGVLDLDHRIGGDKDEKLRWMCHAEANAIFNAARIGTILNGATIYVTLFPCVDCAGAIIQSGIRRVYSEGGFWRNDTNGDDGSRSYRVLAEAGIQIHAKNLSGQIHFDHSHDEPRSAGRSSRSKHSAAKKASRSSKKAT